ncbi:MAG TPA: hypothetical protein DEF72_04750 [Gammaproteobacteria bacterium]|nr:hypothetical protein [Gammaproteobacteria bacterium]
MLLTSITRYPIKGLAGELLTEVTVKEGETLPGDRRHALQFSDRVPTDPINWRPKKYFLQSTQSNLCANIQIQWTTDYVIFSHSDQTLTISNNLLDGRTLTDWISRLDPSLGAFTLETLESGFTDEKEAYVSLLNRSTISAIANAIGATDYPERYRGNLLIEQAKPFQELQWVGKTLMMGTAEFEVIEPIVRCRAIEYDWHGKRNRGFLDRLDQLCKTDVCGLFLRASSSGLISTGNRITVID